MLLLVLKESRKHCGAVQQSLQHPLRIRLFLQIYSGNGCIFCGTHGSYSCRSGASKLIPAQLRQTICLSKQKVCFIHHCKFANDKKHTFFVLVDKVVLNQIQIFFCLLIPRTVGFLSAMVLQAVFVHQILSQYFCKFP